MHPTKRAETVYADGRCLKCITGRGHVARDCPWKSKIKCEVEVCANRRHHTLLHGSEFRITKAEPTKTPAPIMKVPSAPPAETVYLGAVGDQDSDDENDTLFMLAPVRIEVGKRSFNTYALLDSGANRTAIREDIARSKLGLCGPSKEARITGYDGEVKKVPVDTVSFQISAWDGSNRATVARAYVMTKLVSAYNPKLTEEQRAQWPHLEGLDIKEPDVGEVTVIIGMDNNVLLEYRETRPPEEGVMAPTAYKTAFGWTLGGRTGEPICGRNIVGHFVEIEEDPMYDLQEQVKQFWHIEAKDVHLEHNVMSAEDRRGEEILNSTARLVDGHYEIGLMWKDEDPKLPDNKKVALQRLFALERRFKKEPKFAEEYHAVMEEYVRLGHARLMTAEESKGRTSKTWYLPHHGVVSESSTTTKVRIVFDGAAEYDGTSLNKKLLRGPNYLVSLIGVLLRFRRNKIPVSGDIVKMFHQVRVAKEDREAFRFLYGPPGSEEAPKSYQMLAHIFGAVSSPSTCIYALNKTADDHADEYDDEVTNCVRKNFYVDNYLDSLSSEDKAIERARKLTELLSKGGFELKKWTSTSKKVLTALSHLGLAQPEDEVNLDALPIERTLGIQWSRQEDAFTFKISPRFSNDEQVTRRQCLSAVSSVFDPLGLVAPVVFEMKVLLRDIWTKQQIGWDDYLPEEYRTRCVKWCDDLRQLEEVKVPRCFLTEQCKVKSQSVHVFTDASQLGLGSVAYLRTIYENEQVGVSFIMAKTHVAPNKGYSIPRLELEGAVDGLTLATTICRELELNIKTVTFHCDSQTVLRWINSSHCKFEVFVANRIGKILLRTERKQWRHVPGVENPADYCSRGISPRNVTELKKFHQGPEFLKKPVAEWSQWEALTEIYEHDPEIVRLNVMRVDKEQHLIDMCVEKFSKRLKVVRVVSWCRRFITNCKAKARKQTTEVGALTATEIQAAAVLCTKRAQQIHFADEIKCLKERKLLPKKSELRGLRPFVDEDGLLRVGGRLQNAQIGYSAQHPLILPGKHRLTRLTVRQIHESNMHVKSDTIPPHKSRILDCGGTVSSKKCSTWVFGVQKTRC